MLSKRCLRLSDRSLLGFSRCLTTSSSWASSLLSKKWQSLGQWSSPTVIMSPLKLDLSSADFLQCVKNPPVQYPLLSPTHRLRQSLNRPCLTPSWMSRAMSFGFSDSMKIGMGAYFGQPPGGFFLFSDFLIASRQSPSILRVSGLGPRFAEGLIAFLAFLISSSKEHIKGCRCKIVRSLEKSRGPEGRRSALLVP